MKLGALIMFKGMGMEETQQCLRVEESMQILLAKNQEVLPTSFLFLYKHVYFGLGRI